MAVEQRIVELVVDASGVVSGTRLGAAAYDHFGDRAEAAMVRAQAAADRQFTAFQTRAPRSVDAVAAAYDNLQSKMDPVFNAQLRAEREMTQSLAVVNRAVLLGVTTQEQATRDIIRLKRMQVEAINQVRDAQLLADRSMAGANDNFPMGNEARYRRQNLNYQIFDIGQSAALGMPLGMVAMQQVPQILQLYAGQGGFNAALKDTAALLGTVARVLGPVAAAAGIAYGAWKLLASYSVEATLAVSDSTRELAASAASWQSIEGQVTQLSQVQKSYNDVIADSARIHTDATGTIIANTEREFNAKKVLLELEYQRQQAAIETQGAAIALTGQQLKSDIAQGVFSRDDLERMGVYDPRVGQFARVPDEYSTITKTQELIDQSPLTAKIKEMRANLELTELAADKLAKALQKTFDPTAGGVVDANGEVNPFVPRNPAIPGVNPRRSLAGDDAVFKVVDLSANRLRDLRQEVELFGLVGGAAAKARFEQEALNAVIEKHIELSPEQRAAISKDAAAYGELTDKLSRMRMVQDAQFEVDQMLRSDREANIAAQLRSYNMPVDLESQDAALLRSIDIAKQYGETWREVGDIGRSAIDQITDGMADGFKDFDDMAKSILGDINKEFLQLAIANPLKNAIFGDTNTTLDNIGGAKGFFSALTGGKMPMDPALRNVASMQVTAATVVVNGGVSGFSPVAGVTRMQAAANGNDPFASVMTGADGTGPNGGAQSAWNFWKSKGLADHQVAGILGNIKAESAFNPLAVGDGGNAFGLYQHNDRRNSLFAAIGGKGNLSNALAQHEFAYSELMGPENRAWQALLASKDVRGATAAFAGFERPSGFSWANPEAAHNFTGRLAGAEEALKSFGGSVGTATQDLGVLGSGFGKVGNALSQVGIGASGKGSGGLFDNLLGGLGSLFGGVSPTSSFWAPNTTYSNWLMGMPSFDGGGDTGMGNRSGGLDGKGGFLAMMHPRETVTDHTRENASQPRQIVKREFNIINPPPGYQADVEEEEDDYGNEKVNVTFSKAISREMGRTGSPANKTLRSMGARKPRRKL